MFEERKAQRIQGGRGCGKTMFIRYLCHPTRFSPTRRNISSVEFSWLGLYWRPDTQFCRLMKEIWLGDRDAQLAFIHYATLVILNEVACCIDSIANADLEGGPCDLRNMKLPPAVCEFLGGKVDTIEGLKDFSAVERAKLELWVQNPSLERPIMLRFESVLEQIANKLATADLRLKNIFFRIFVDEFENLEEHQRRLVCDYVKHPTKRFSVSFAMRQHAISHFLTSGSEQIVEDHDVKTIDLEGELSKNDGRDFQLVAAEFLILGLIRSGHISDGGVVTQERLMDVAYLPERNLDSYRTAVLARARDVLPALTSREVAAAVMTDKALCNRLKEAVDKGLRLHGEKNLKNDDFFNSKRPEASIVAAAALNRLKPGPAEVHRQMKLLDGEDAASSSFHGLIDNNLHGCLFYLYIGLPRRANLLYAGFDRFCSLASPNLRFFQELCHVAFLLNQEQQGSVQSTALSVDVPVELQAEAAEQVSETFLNEILRLGLQGTQLLEIMRRLGRLFEAAHRRPSQSEVEINHFSIDESDRVGLSKESKDLITQAKIWSVFYEEQDTKNKSNYDLVQTDIIPNRIFCPSFGISYRKKKKLTLTAAQVNTIMTGSGEQFDAILRDYSERWRVGDAPETPTTRDFFQ
uniref:Uncharacterized protein n=1 Tax=Curvibacter symbiont subsp. Hydra magnipapillata TaxID=667019 RepID=C9YFH9_CURXX|nr:hypothetical protein Csp_D33350 [Curvibacter putative symbiont of Hydra magnipapillata]